MFLLAVHAAMTVPCRVQFKQFDGCIEIKSQKDKGKEPKTISKWEISPLSPFFLHAPPTPRDTVAVHQSDTGPQKLAVCSLSR